MKWLDDVKVIVSKAKYKKSGVLKGAVGTICKVENGFILNLLGEKKNKIAYNYES